MIESLKAILKNTAIIYAVEVINKILLFVFVIYAARILGVTVFGYLSYALTLYLLLQMLGDFGFTSYVPIEVARSPEKKEKLFTATSHLRMAVTALILFVFAVYLIVAEMKDIWIFVLIAGTGLILSSKAQSFILTARGISRMGIDGGLRVGATFVTTALCLVALKTGTGMAGVATAFFLGNLSMLGLSFFVNRKYRILKMSYGRMQMGDYRDVLKGSLPYVSIVILSSIFSRADTILLQHLQGPAAVGLYHASSHVLSALLIFQAAFGMVLLPVLSRHMIGEELGTAQKITQTGIKIMGYAGVFLSVVIFMTADKIIEVLYFSAEYQDAVKGLKIFSLVVLVLYISTPVGYLLLASPLAKKVPLIQVFMVCLSISLNLLLIPRFGFQGAAMVRLLTEVFGLVISMVLIDRALFRINYGAGLVKPAIAGLSVAVVIYFVKSLLFIPFYLIVYGGVLYLLGGISSKDLTFMREVFTREERA
ncbi:MAG: oligosaccharide flippase family protein [Thermodesulfovibrionales bacterium]|jgi:O-antigen/teichoic acid export membrane protein